MKLKAARYGTLSLPADVSQRSWLCAAGLMVLTETSQETKILRHRANGQWFFFVLKYATYPTSLQSSPESTELLNDLIRFMLFFFPLGPYFATLTFFVKSFFLFGDIQQLFSPQVLSSFVVPVNCFVYKMSEATILKAQGHVFKCVILFNLLPKTSTSWICIGHKWPTISDIQNKNTKSQKQNY